MLFFHFARSIKRLYHWQFSKEVFSNREYRGQSETLENRVYDGFSPPQAPKKSGFFGCFSEFYQLFPPCFLQLGNKGGIVDKNTSDG